MKTCTRFLVRTNRSPHQLAIKLATAAIFFQLNCTTRGESEENSADSESSTQGVVGKPFEGQIKGILTKPTALTSEPGRGITHCTLPAGPIQVALFEKGFYKIHTVDRRPCSTKSADSFKGFVPLDSVQIEDAAYAPKLKRIGENSAIDIKMVYAGNQIFCSGGKCLINQALYAQPRCYLHPKVAPLIQSAALFIQKKRPGIKLSMLDCYRPIYVQKEMAKLVKDPNVVAQPTPGKFGFHNGGLAVDVSLADESGKLLDMGSGFDDFKNPKRKVGASGLTPQQKENRALLTEAMVKGAGLSPFVEEWWHFFLNTNAEPLDIAL